MSQNPKVVYIKLPINSLPASSTANKYQNHSFIYMHATNTSIYLNETGFAVHN
jgi:hypothetical protein